MTEMNCYSCRSSFVWQKGDPPRCKKCRAEFAEKYPEYDEYDGQLIQDFRRTLVGISMGQNCTACSCRCHDLARAVLEKWK